jgi:hypothetical protein
MIPRLLATKKDHSSEWSHVSKMARVLPASFSRTLVARVGTVSSHCRLSRAFAGGQLTKHLGKIQGFTASGTEKLVPGDCGRGNLRLMSTVRTGKGYLTTATAANKLNSHFCTAPFRTPGAGFQRFTGNGPAK